MLKFTSVPVCRRDLPFDANMLELDGRSPTDSQPYLGMGTIVVKETICVTARAQRHFRHRDTMSRRKKISPRRHGEHQDLLGGEGWLERLSAFLPVSKFGVGSWQLLEDGCICNAKSLATPEPAWERNLRYPQRNLRALRALVVNFFSKK